MAGAEKVRVGVIGVGRQGRKHVRIYHDIPGVELVAVADMELENRQHAERLYGARSYGDVDKMLAAEELEAVSVCVPTVMHRDVSIQAIKGGLHVLVEKPIAFNNGEARDIIDAAKEAGVILMVGHNERFNSAIVQMKKMLGDGELGKVYQLESRRMGPLPSRTPGSGVVINIAVHEIDIMHHLLGASVTRVQAEMERKIHSAREDLLSCVLRFSDDTIGSMSINWLTPINVREISAIGEKGVLRANYLTQDLTFCKASDPEGRCDVLECIVQKRESARRELEAFIAAVRGEAEVPVTGEDGLRALVIAEAIIASGLEHRVINFVEG